MAKRGGLRFEVHGFDELLRDLESLADHPTVAERERLDATMQNLFLESQALTHHHVGNLRASGRLETSYDRFGRRWEGTISWTDEDAHWELGVNAERDPEGGHSAFYDYLVETGEERLREALREPIE